MANFNVISNNTIVVSNEEATLQNVESCKNNQHVQCTTVVSNEDTSVQNVENLNDDKYVQCSTSVQNSVQNNEDQGKCNKNVSDCDSASEYSDPNEVEDGLKDVKISSKRCKGRIHYAKHKEKIR